MEKQREATLNDTVNFCIEAWLQRVSGKQAPGTQDRYWSVFKGKLEKGIGQLTLKELIAPAFLFDYADELKAPG